MWVIILQFSCSIRPICYQAFLNYIIISGKWFNFSSGVNTMIKMCTYLSLVQPISTVKKKTFLFVKDIK